jgi:deazaflavin-dependent oxidoreductase (nitroreductase family)
MSSPIPDSAYPPTDISLLGDAHVRAYRETDGERGYLWNGVPILLLTTRGRVSGEPRTIPIIFTQVGNAWVIIASRGGSPTHPKWYLNILAEPRVEVQVRADRFDAVARTAESAERELLWAKAIATWPKYDQYQSRTTRLIPVVVLEPKAALKDGA